VSPPKSNDCADGTILMEELDCHLRMAAEMRKLYMIRLQNGNSVVLQADDEHQALEFAGLRSDGSSLAEHLKASGENVDPAEVQLMMMQSGLGPQNYTIRELNDFHCVFNLDDEGTFSSGLDGEESLDEFYLDYPELDAAEEELSDIISQSVEFEDGVRIRSEREKELMDAAVLKERTRLTAVL
jgi:hypothetical protein